MNIFQSFQPLITGNPNLLRPQIEAYEATFSYYKEFNENREILLILPTGTGKTGLMALLPFQLSNGRVLIIAPGKIIRRTIFKEFDSINNPEQTFWYKRNVIRNRNSLPKSYLYTGYDSAKVDEKEIMLKKIYNSDIIITNIHKIVGSTEDVNLKNLLPPDFFDMIILDEAHHSAASMWKETLDYFTASKVIKLTGTPYRSDGLEISTNPYDPVYEFSLGEAIQEGLVKDTIKQEEIPHQLTFIDKRTGKKYSLVEARKQLGNDWVNRSVAMDEKCSKEVIQKTAQILREKRQSYPKHQVLGVACNDEHAQDLTKWFEEEGLSATYVSSHLQSSEIERRINDFNNGLYDAVINIQMLGEGFDNPNISIISIFRPFKTLTPYAQVIGRGLRKIRVDGISDIDNFCNVVYHKELDLDLLWFQYKNNKSYADIKEEQLKRIREEFSPYEQLSLDFGELGMIEVRPNLEPIRSPIPNPEPPISIIGSYVKSYQSAGLGNNDSFSDDGYNRYRLALAKISIESENEQKEKISQYNKLYKSGLLTKKEHQTLVDSLEIKMQEDYDLHYKAYKGLIDAERMRSDFTNWLNTQIDYFFRSSKLDKKGQELYNDSCDFSHSNEKPSNNVGFLTKIIRQTLYQQTKKSIGAFTPKDFAFAKEFVIEKLNFYLDQYKRAKEE